MPKNGKVEGCLVCEDCMHQNQDSIVTPNDEERCSNCGISLSEIVKGSRFGCAKCYESFAETLPYIIASVQMTSQNAKHVGQTPCQFAMESARKTTRQEFAEEISEKINKACRSEDYEGADRLKKVLEDFSKISDEEGRDARSMNELALFIFKFRSGELEGLH